MERPGRWHRPVPRELGEQARATFWTWETFLSSLFSGILREFPEGQFEDLGHGNDSRLPLFSTLSQAHVCSRNTPLFTRLPPRTTRSLFFKLLNVSHRKERHLISLPSTHTHTHNKSLLKQYLYLLMHSDGFFSIPVPNMLVVTH